MISIEGGTTNSPTQILPTIQSKFENDECESNFLPRNNNNNNNNNDNINDNDYNNAIEVSFSP
jgi:hypothetical protein